MLEHSQVSPVMGATHSPRKNFLEAAKRLVKFMLSLYTTTNLIWQELFLLLLPPPPLSDVEERGGPVV